MDAEVAGQIAELIYRDRVGGVALTINGFEEVFELRLVVLEAFQHIPDVVFGE